jgi:hypothetical protein
MTRFLPHRTWRPLGAALLALACHSPAAWASDPSEASSMLSALPVAVSIGGSALTLSAGVVLTVVAVDVVAGATVWVLKSASGAATLSLRVSGRVLEGVTVGVGTVLVGTALSTGVVLSAASEAVAFVPNQIGASLLYNETITR